jgi:hypothetical protein
VGEALATREALALRRGSCPACLIRRNVRRIRPGERGLKASRVLILVALLIIVPGQALAYEDTGYDPADREGDYPDIRTTTRSVWKNDDGPRFLRISFTGEEMLGVAAYWEMAVRLDTRGDGSFDVLMRFWDLDMSGTGCFARKRGAGDRVDGTLRLRTHGASCRIDTSQFRLTKEVRWKLKSPALHDPGEVEVAPNTGYYP